MFFNIFKKNVEKSNQKKADQKKSPPRKVNSNRIGELGEYKINIQLDQLKGSFHLSDLLIPNSKSKSGYSQVDHVVLASYGLFVIETKNYAGTIYGDINRGNWSVNGKFSFMNPFHQNFGHIQAIQSVLSVSESSIISIVSFTKRCTFKVNPELRKIQSRELIVYDVELSEFLNRKINLQKLQNQKPIFSDEELQHLYKKLQNINITDPNIREKHIALLKSNNNKSELKGNKEEKVSTCVVCGKEVSEKVKMFCSSNKKFEGKILCFEHQKNF